MCFVLSWNTGFKAMWIAAWLSQNNCVGLSMNECPNSWRSNCSQTISLVALAIARYSASALERATDVYFLLFTFLIHQVASYKHTKTWCWLPIHQVTCPISINISNYINIAIIFHQIPLPDAIFKYLRIWFINSKWLLVGFCINCLTYLLHMLYLDELLWGKSICLSTVETG
jgi:hypothetical protein